MKLVFINSCRLYMDAIVTACTHCLYSSATFWVQRATTSHVNLERALVLVLRSNPYHYEEEAGGDNTQLLLGSMKARDNDPLLCFIMSDVTVRKKVFCHKPIARHDSSKTEHHKATQIKWIDLSVDWLRSYMLLVCQCDSPGLVWISEGSTFWQVVNRPQL